MRHILLVSVAAIALTAATPTRAAETCYTSGEPDTVALLGTDGLAGWRVWAAPAAEVQPSTATERTPIGLTSWLVVSAEDYEVSAAGAEPFTLYVCPPGVLPPGGGIPTALPFVGT